MRLVFRRSHPELPLGNTGTADRSLCRRDRRGAAGVGVWRVARSTPVPTATTARRPTVFGCRTTGTVSRRCLVRTPEEIAYLVNGELDLLGHGGVRLTPGRCPLHRIRARHADSSLRS